MASVHAVVSALLVVVLAAAVLVAATSDAQEPTTPSVHGNFGDASSAAQVPRQKPPSRQMTVVDALREAARMHQEGDYAGALGLYDQVLRARPGNSDALHLRGLVMMQWGRFAEAEANITAAVDGVWPHGPGVESVVDGTRDGSGMPRSAANYLNSLGQVYRHARRWADAEVAYRLAMAGDPKAVAPVTNLGDVVGKQGRVAEAVELYETAMDMSPPDKVPSILASIGACRAPLPGMRGVQGMQLTMKLLVPCYMVGLWPRLAALVGAACACEQCTCIGSTTITKAGWLPCVGVSRRVTCRMRRRCACTVAVSTRTMLPRGSQLSRVNLVRAHASQTGMLIQAAHEQ